MSAKSPADVAALRERLIERFAGELEEAELLVPWARGAVASAIHAGCIVLAQDHGDTGTTFRVRAPARVLDRLREAIRTGA
jgi:GTP-binding protein HflX